MASLIACRRIPYPCPAAIARRPTSITTRRPYQSAAHPLPAPFTATEDAILSAAMRHVPAEGFTQTSLVRGARDAGYLDASVNLFPRGVFDLVNYHLVTQRLALKTKMPLTEEEAQRGGVGKKIRDVTWARLQANAEAGVVGRWPEALALMAQPSYATASLHELSLLADEIWHLAGDKDVTFAWYTKRGSLSAVYASTELFMTRDTSIGFADTRSFLDRRLGEVQTMGGALGSVREWTGFSASALVNVLRSKGVRI